MNNAHKVDENLTLFRSAVGVEVPCGGWARSIRNALGMTNAQLARRMNGKTSQSVNGLLNSEATRTIKLRSLDELAQALNCRVVYALVPNLPIEVLRHERAITLAEEKLKGLFHSMELEGQAVTAEKRANILSEYASQLLHMHPRDLWN